MTTGLRRYEAGEWPRATEDLAHLGSGPQSADQQNMEELNAVTLLSRSGEWTEAAERADAVATRASTLSVRCEAVALAASAYLRNGDPNMANERLRSFDQTCLEGLAGATIADATRRALSDLLADASIGRLRDLVRMGMWEPAVDEAVAILQGPKPAANIEVECEALALAQMAVRRGGVAVSVGPSFGARFEQTCPAALGDGHWIIVGYAAE